MPDPSSLRVLEVGDRRMFADALPEQTTLLWTGVEPLPPRPGWHNFGRAAVGVLQAALRGEGFDVIVCHPPSHHPLAPRCLARLVSRFPATAPAHLLRTLGTLYLRRGAALPLGLVDTHDHRRIHPLVGVCRAYFKRELSPELQSPKLHPFSVGLAPWRLGRIPEARMEKTADVFFAGSAAHSPVRGAGLPQLEALRREGVRVDLVKGRLEQEEFIHRCASAWLTWSPEGLGWDCFRHYEAAACRSIPVINTPTVRTYQPLREGEHALYYRPEGEALAETLRSALRDHDRLRTMGEAAREHVLRYLTHPRLCRMVVETLMAS